MIYRRAAAAGLALIGSAVGLLLSAAKTKKELNDIRENELEQQAGQEEKKMDKFKEGLIEFKNTPGAVLLDVREQTDYDEGHIPGSIHADLQTIQFRHEDPETPIFIYCYQGNRSAMAASILQEHGFMRVKDIGGIDWYDGELEVSDS